MEGDCPYVGIVNEYVKLVRLLGFWFGEDSMTFPVLFILFSKLLCMSAATIFCGYSLLSYDDLGIRKGFIVYVPSGIFAVLGWAAFFVKRGVHERIVKRIGNLMVTYNEPWMVELREPPMKYFRLFRLTVIVVTASNCAYIGSSLFVDIVLFGVLRQMSKPLFSPHAFSPYLDSRNITSGYLFYSLSSLNMFPTFFVIRVSIFSPFCYIMILVCLLSELKIVKEKIKFLSSTTHPSQKDQLFRSIIEHQVEIIRLANDVNDFAGFTSSLFCVYTAILLTLCLFTAIAAMGSDPLALGAFVMAFAIYLTAGWLLCMNGQLIQDECEDIAFDLYNSPWVQRDATYRKDIGMMIRQFQRGLPVNFHGLCPLNHETFSQIISSAYSYFTIIQTAID